MQAFRYWRDPLCLGCCLAYALNRWLLRCDVAAGFFHSYFNDLLLIPCALPLFLWLHRRLGLRADDQPPQLAEVALHLGLWSVLFEALGPRIMPHVTGDPWDVVAYAAGAIVAFAGWRRRELVLISKPVFSRAAQAIGMSERTTTRRAWIPAP